MPNEKRLYLSQIFKAYNQARTHARRGGDLKRIERINKALGILLSSNYYQNEKENYQPSTSSCTCKDWEFRHAAKRQYTGGCKHMLAESMLLAASTNILFTGTLSTVVYKMSTTAYATSGTIPGALIL